ncbi:MAG: DinB family protein [Dehalococcoidia bacterium]
MEDLIEQLAATPKTLAHLVAEAGDEQLDAPYQGGWSARTTLAHLRDDEYLCLRAALTRMLAEDIPALHFIDGADWEPTRNRTRERKDWLLADFALQRQASLSILRMLRPEDLQRRGTRNGREFTLEQLVGVWVRHDREHIAQLEAAIGETLSEVLERRARME